MQTSVKRPDYDAEVNVVGTVQVAEAARAAGRAGRLLVDRRRDLRRVRGPGARTRRCARCRRTGSRSSAPRSTCSAGTGSTAAHVVLRLANVYGPRQDAGLEGGVVAIFLERMARGEETTIFGDGLQERDFVYVGDVVEAMLAAAGHDGGVFNVGTGEATSVLDLHRACRAIAGSEAEPRFAPARLGDVRRSVLDVSRAARRARLARGSRSTTACAGPGSG